MGKGKTNNVVTQHHYSAVRSGTDLDDPNDGLSSNVADMIRMATMCHRQKMGDLIWYGWQCANNNSKPSWLSNGSAAIGLSKNGARRVLTAMEDGRCRRRHVDLALLEWLQLPGEAELAGACYIYPSVGAFFAHVSGCDPKNYGEKQGGRPAGFIYKSASKGTRVKHDDDKNHREKYIVQWKAEASKTERTWIPFESEEILHGEEYPWKSFKPDEPTAADKKGGKGKGKATVEPTAHRTDRQYRLQKQWNVLERMRTFE